MASSWGIFIDQQANGSITFTPDVPGAKVGQPLGVNQNDNVTWNNRTNNPITLQSIQPATPFPFGAIPAGGVSNPIFNVTETIGYAWVRPPPKARAGRKAPTPRALTPDAWIVVV
jgi:hypothetical protein